MIHDLKFLDRKEDSIASSASNIQIDFSFVKKKLKNGNIETILKILSRNVPRINIKRKKYHYQ